MDEWNLTIRLGDGSGSFPIQRIFSVLTGNSLALALGDLNHDAVLDIVVVNQTTNALIILQDANPCFVCDDFNDLDLIAKQVPGRRRKDSGRAATGDAVGSATLKGDLLAPTFTCTSSCTYEANMSVQAGGRVSLFGWYVAGSHSVELRLKQDKQKLFIKQKQGGKASKKKISFAVLPNTFYNLKLTYNGSVFQVSVNDVPIPTLNCPSIGTPGAGRTVFRVKSGTGALISGTLADILVY